LEDDFKIDFALLLSVLNFKILRHSYPVSTGEDLKRALGIGKSTKNKLMFLEEPFI
jgi:hypothetical protein